MSLAMAVLRRHRRIKRRAVIEEIRAAGHDYSESAIAQALRALATTGAVTNKGGEHGELLLTSPGTKDDGAEHRIAEVTVPLSSDPDGGAEALVSQEGGNE